MTATTPCNECHPKETELKFMILLPILDATSLIIYIYGKTYPPSMIMSDPVVYVEASLAR